MKNNLGAMGAGLGLGMLIAMVTAGLGQAASGAWAAIEKEMNLCSVPSASMGQIDPKVAFLKSSASFELLFDQFN